MSLTQHFSSALFTQAGLVKLVLLDVDGVLTEGGLHYSAQGEEVKTFNTLDGHGLKLLQSYGVEVAIISGRDSPALKKRLLDLGISHVYAGVHDKKAVAEQLLSALGLSWQQVAVMGDDWPDLSILMAAGFSAAPPNAHMEVLSRVDWQSSRTAGQGAVRELCDVLLMAKGVYDSALQEALK